MDSTVGERLRIAVTEWGSVVEFQSAISERGIRGTSRTTIHNYLSGRTNPSREFLREAAHILGVGEPWLRAGTGPKREETAQERTLLEQLRARCRYLDQLSPGQQRLFLELVLRYAETAADFEDPKSAEVVDQLADLAADLEWMLWLPLHPGAWGFRTGATADRSKESPVRIDKRDLSEYMTAAMHALSLALLDKGRGQSLRYHSTSLVPTARHEVEDLLRWDRLTEFGRFPERFYPDEAESPP